MAIMESIDFSYDGKYSSYFGIFNVTLNNGMFEETFLARRSILETSTRGNAKPYFNGVQVEPLTLKLTFAFADTWDDKLIRDVARWLNQDYYKPLFFSDNIDRIFYCMAVDDLALIHNGLKQGYVTLTMRCDSPYAYSRTMTDAPIDLSSNTTGGTPITFDNKGDVNCYPEVWIQKLGNGGDIKIVNQTNAGQEFRFSSPKVSGTLYFAGDVADGETVKIGGDTYEFDSDNIITNPTVAPKLTLAVNASSTLAVGTYFVTYSWVNANGETIVSPESSLAVTSGQNLVVTLPDFPSYVTSANIYIGTTAGSGTNQGNTTTVTYTRSTALVAGTIKPMRNPTILPTLAKAVNAGSTLAAGSYYVSYSWVNASGETMTSQESKIDITTGNNIVVTLPTFPSNVLSANVYIGTLEGTGTKQGNTTTTAFTQSAILSVGSAKPTVDRTIISNNIPVKLFIVDPITAPILTAINDSSSTLPAGTYYVKYSWANAFGETKVSLVASITTLANQKIDVTMPTFPMGAVFANVYIGTVSGSETRQTQSFGSKYIVFKPLVIGVALPNANTTVSTTYLNAIRALAYIVNSSSTNGVTSLASSTTSILFTGVDSTPINVSTKCANAGWSGSQITSAGLLDGETIYVDNEREYIESYLQYNGAYVPNSEYRHKLFNNQFLEMVVGVNTLRVYGNVILRFRYKLKTLA